MFSSCEVIEGPYMSDSVNPIDTTTNNYVKNILIEDFTGHLCKNCPDAASELEAIQSVYGSQIIGLAIHSGTTFARSYPIDPVSNPDDKFIYDEFKVKMSHRKIPIVQLSSDYAIKAFELWEEEENKIRY